MGRADLIGNGKHHLIPAFQPTGKDGSDAGYTSTRRKNSTAAGARTSPVTQGRVLTQHTGLPPRDTGAAGKAPARPLLRRPKAR
jgi:hypothetical protein